MARCARCGRTLKNPASIARGLGSECAGTGSGSRPLKNWNRRVMNSAKLKNGLPIMVGNRTIIAGNLSEYERQWLIKYKYILEDGDVSDELLEEIFINNGGFNDEERKGIQ